MAEKGAATEARCGRLEDRAALGACRGCGGMPALSSYPEQDGKRDRATEFFALERARAGLLSAAIEVTEVTRIFHPNPVTYLREGEWVLWSLVDASGIPRSAAVVWVNGELVDRDLWTRAMIEPGDNILIRLIPQGEDAPKIIQTMVTLFSFALGPFVGPGVLLAGALVNVGISLAFPPPSVSMGDPGEANNSPQLQGSRNALRPWTPVPVVIGNEYRVWPPLAARPYTEVVGGEQFLRMIFEVHHGPCQLAESDMRIGTEPLENFEDIEVEIREGLDSDDPRELFTSEVTEQSYSIVLNDMDPHEFTTETDTTECTFDFTYPYGLGCFHEKKGSLLTVEQTFQLKYRAVGAGSWNNLVPAPPYGPGVTHQGSGVIKIRARHRGLCQRGFRFIFPNADKWEVQIEMLTSEADDDAASNSIMDECRLTRFRSIWPSDIITLDNVATVSLRIRASDQLNGVIDTFNCLVKPLVPTWNAVDEWNTTLINTGLAAWHFAAVLRGHAAATPIDDALLDGAGLLDWAQFCSSESLEVSGIIDAEQPKEYWLRQIAATSRAKASVVDGKYSVVIDQEQTSPVQVFTDRNSSNLRGSFKLPDLPHALRVRFVDRESNYQIAERLVCDDGYDEDTAEKIHEIDMWGISDPDLAWRHGRYHLAAGKLRRRVLQLDVDFEHLVCNRGDRVDVQNRSSLLSVGAARIISWIDIWAGIIEITFDAPIAMEPMGGKEYEIQIRKSDGIIQTWEAFYWVNPSEEPEGNTRVYLDNPSVTGEDPAWGDLLIIGEKDNVSLPMIVSDIKHQSDLKATLELVDYVPEIYDADSGEIPDWDPKITSPIHKEQDIPSAPSILGVISDETVLIYAEDNRVVPCAVLSFALTRSFVPVTAIQGQYRLLDDEEEDAGEGPWRTVELVEPSTGQVIFVPVEEKREYDFRIRAVTDRGLASEWVYVARHYIVGRTTPPPNPEDLQITPLEVITWDIEYEPKDLAGYVIRYQQGQEIEWSTGIPAHGGLITAREVSLDNLPIVPTGIEITLMVKAVDVVGIESDDFAYLITTLTDRQLNVIDSNAEEPSWSGTKVNCSVSGTELHADTDTGGFWTEDEQLFWTQDSNLFWTAAYKAMTYSWNYTIPSGAAGTMRIPVTGQGQWTTYYRIGATGDYRKWPGEIEVEGSEIIYVQISIPGGPVQGQLHTAHIEVDVPDRHELHLDQTNTGSGTERVAPTTAFNAITQVVCTISGSGSSAVGYRIRDKNPTSGPWIELLDDGGSVCGGIFDCELIGY